MEYIIRQATINDSKELDNLLTLLIQDERKYDNSINKDFVVKDYYKNYLLNNKYVYVAEINNNIIGFIDSFFINDNVAKTKVKIKALFVKDEYRNNKIATSLINKVIEIAKDNNCDNIEINVIKDNEVAKALYNKLKFNTFYETLRLDL